MIVLPIPGDGNCLFHALASFFQSSKIDHALIRRMLVHYIYQHGAQFKVDIEAGGYRDIDQYCAHMGQNGTWGDGVCVQAFGMLFKVNVWICYGKDGDPSQIVHFDGRPHIGLLLQGQHYDRILQFWYSLEQLARFMF